MGVWVVLSDRSGCMKGAFLFLAVLKNTHLFAHKNKQQSGCFNGGLGFLSNKKKALRTSLSVVCESCASPCCPCRSNKPTFETELLCANGVFYPKGSVSSGLF